jgi:hypothetical protein
MLAALGTGIILPMLAKCKQKKKTTELAEACSRRNKTTATTVPTNLSVGTGFFLPFEYIICRRIIPSAKSKQIGRPKQKPCKAVWAEPGSKNMVIWATNIANVSVHVMYCLSKK